MTDPPSNVVDLWPDLAHALTTHIDEASTPEHAVLRVAGDLDLTTAPLVLEVLTGMAEWGCRRVDVDLEDVTSCDGAGLAVLMEGHRRIAETGGRMTVHDLCPSARRILDVCGLTTSFEARVPVAAYVTRPASPGVGHGPRLRLLPPVPEST